MNRRSFLSLLGALATLPVFGSRLRREKTQSVTTEKPWNLWNAYTKPFDPMYVTGIAAGPIALGDLVVWEYPASPIRIRVARDRADFSRHVAERNAGVATKTQRPGGTMTAQLNGQMTVKAL